MVDLTHRTPTIGSIIKQVMAINPELSAQDLIEIIRQSIRTQGDFAGEFASVEIVDEKKAIQLARAKGT